MKKLFIPPVFVVVVLMLIVTFSLYFPKLNIIPFPYNLAGLFVLYAGVTIMGKARDLFRQHHTTLEIEAPTSLIRDGIFAKTRNPMYIGMFLLLFGLAICFRNVISIITPSLFLLLVNIFVIPQEEKLMHNAFGDEYLDYKKHVKRWV